MKVDKNMMESWVVNQKQWLCAVRQWRSISSFGSNRQAESESHSSSSLVAQKCQFCGQSLFTVSPHFHNSAADTHHTVWHTSRLYQTNLIPHTMDLLLSWGSCFLWTCAHGMIGTITMKLKPQKTDASSIAPGTAMSVCKAVIRSVHHFGWDWKCLEYVWAKSYITICLTILYTSTLILTILWIKGTFTNY